MSQWVPDPELAPKVRQAFELRAAGASYEEILEATRIFPVRGSYVAMFRNKSYMGIRKCGDLEVKDAHEPLVDRQTWDAVQSTLGTRGTAGGAPDPGEPQPRRETLPFLLTGMARCAESDAAMLGKEDWSGGRKAPFRHYICGRKNREGWRSCPSGKIPADGPEQAVLKFVGDNLLTPEFMMAQTAATGGRIPKRERLLKDRVEDARRRLAGVEKSIAVLLDLAEQYGAANAGARLVEREAERREVLAEMEELEVRQDAEMPAEPQGAVQSLLVEMQATLAGTDTQAKQALLRKLAVSVTLGKEQGEVTYASPSGSLRTLIQYLPGEYTVKHRTMEYGSTAERLFATSPLQRNALGQANRLTRRM